MCLTVTLEQGVSAAIRIGLILGFLACGVPAGADCAFMPGRLVKARVLRCEPSAPYVMAAALSKPPYGPVATKEGYVTMPPDYLATRSEEKAPGQILVLAIDRELRFHPASTGAGIRDVEPEQEWRRVVEQARVWWRGESTPCGEGVDNRANVELWLHRPCCCVVPGLGPCLADMDIGEIPPESIVRLTSGISSPE